MNISKMRKRSWKVIDQPVYLQCSKRYWNKSLKSQFESTYRIIKVIKSSQHGSVKNKSHQNDLIAFHDRIIGLADKEEALETICLNCSNALGAVPQDTHE